MSSCSSTTPGAYYAEVAWLRRLYFDEQAPLQDPPVVGQVLAQQETLVRIQNKNSVCSLCQNLSAHRLIPDPPKECLWQESGMTEEVLIAPRVHVSSK